MSGTITKQLCCEALRIGDALVLIGQVRDALFEPAHTLGLLRVVRVSEGASFECAQDASPNEEERNR